MSKEPLKPEDPHTEEDLRNEILADLEHASLFHLLHAQEWLLFMLQFDEGIAEIDAKPLASRDAKTSGLAAEFERRAEVSRARVVRDKADHARVEAELARRQRERDR